MNQVSGTGDAKPQKGIPFALEAVLKYFRGHISSFVSGLGPKGISSNEDAITEALVRFLNGELIGDHPFRFHYQSKEDDSGSSFRNDFAAIPISRKPVLPSDLIAIVRFEAKRLHERLGKVREREYVLGEYKNGNLRKNSGGIERFKNKSHGSKENWGSLVAYIQTGKVEDWLTKIDRWICEEISKSSDAALQWNDADKLMHQHKEEFHIEFTSSSSRPGLDPIGLFHFFVPLNGVSH